MTENPHGGLGAWQGSQWASVYDSMYPPISRSDPMIAFLLDRIDTGNSVLEFGIGTGRVALPLAESGIRVAGVDSNAAMIDALVNQIGDRPIGPLLHASAVDVSFDQKFDAVLILFNMLFAVLSAADQRKVLTNAVRHVKDDGIVLIENSNPILTTSGYSNGQAIGVRQVDAGGVDLMAGRHRPAIQRIDFNHLRLGASGVNALPVSIRYCWPAELRLMIELSGLVINEEFGDWTLSTYSDRSPSYIAVCRVR